MSPRTTLRSTPRRDEVTQDDLEEFKVLKAQRGRSRGEGRGGFSSGGGGAPRSTRAPRALAVRGRGCGGGAAAAPPCGGHELAAAL